ncbi:hypothetical protein ALC62_13236 [Cyphomyrmex costatus]|uniref:Uncharacterized protein n=1 Tax=Cyphomyrmex costatus TaxID=456900 RepID=A0A195C5Q5_9HYME|nr:hypothetical protein ALC62_13236 [Cyphomyrmex costatus]
MFTENTICSLKQLFTVTSVDRRYFCSQKGKWIGVVTHSPINFGGRSIDHNVLFCSLVFLPAAFDSIRGCGESIYLSRCHEPPVMDGGCSLTLTPKGEAVPRTYPVPATLCFYTFYDGKIATTCEKVEWISWRNKQMRKEMHTKGNARAIGPTRIFITCERSRVFKRLPNAKTCENEG